MLTLTLTLKPFLYCSTVLLFYYYIVILFHCYTVILLYFYTVILLYCYTILLLQMMWWSAHKLPLLTASIDILLIDLPFSKMNKKVPKHYRANVPRVRSFTMYEIYSVQCTMNMLCSRTMYYTIYCTHELYYVLYNVHA
jgi:hypothetical protein